MKRWISMMACTALLLAAIPFAATAAEVTVVAIEAADITLTECADGSWMNVNTDSEWFCYQYEPDYLITLSDGRTMTAGYELGLTTGIWNIDVQDGQSAQTPWGVGEHTVTVTCGDVSGELTVTVEETPVASVTAASEAVYVYHADGSYQTYTDPETGEKDTWFYYMGVDPEVEVTFKDGSKFAGTVGELRAQTGYPVSYRLPQSYGDELGLGTHTATAVFMGVRTDYTIRIMNMIDRVEWVSYPDKQQYDYGEYRDLSGGILRVYFNSGIVRDEGATEDVVLDSCLGQNSAKVMLTSLGREFTISNITPSMMDGSPVTFSFLDQQLSFEPTVKAPPETLTLSVNGDRSMTMTLDGTAMHIERFAGTVYRYSSDAAFSASGKLYTDKGIFAARFDENSDGLTLSLGSEYASIGIYAQSNAVADSSWLHALEAANKIVYALQCVRGDTDYFDGTVLNDNRDDLFRLAIQLYTDYPNMVGGIGETHAIPYETAVSIMEDAYGVSVDMTKSAYYSADDQMLYVPKAYTGTTSAADPVMPIYRDGQWQVQVCGEDDTVYAFTLNDDGKLTSFDVRPLGDVTGDGAMSTADARVILSVLVADDATLTPAQTAAADVDRNGRVTTADAREILKTLVA